MADTQSATMHDARSPLLDVSGLRFGPTKTRIVVDDLTFSANAGDIVAITGPSGAGKTSFLRTLTGEGYVSKGTVTWAGLDLRKRSKQVPRIALMEQTFPLFDELDVAENIMVASLPSFGGLSARDAARAEGLLAQFGLDSSYLKRKPKTLSGGESQRVAMARALASDCPLLLLDEPFSNLDKRSKGRGIKAISRYVRETPAIGVLVLHDDYDALQLADHLIVFSNSGPPIVSTPGPEFDASELARKTGFAVPVGIQVTLLEDGRPFEFLATDAVLLPTNHQQPIGSPGLSVRVRRLSRTPLGTLIALDDMVNGEPIWVFSSNSPAGVQQVRPGDELRLTAKAYDQTNGSVQ